MQKLTNCPKCGNVFVKKVRKFCPACCKELDGVYRKLQNYMDLFPNATTRDIKLALKLDDATIRYLRKEDRLDMC